MEVVRREKVGNPAELRVTHKRSQELLRGPDLEHAALEKYVTERVMTTTLDRARDAEARFAAAVVNIGEPAEVPEAADDAEAPEGGAPAENVAGDDVPPGDGDAAEVPEAVEAADDEAVEAADDDAEAAAGGKRRRRG